ncbi:MAG TPA: superoxide dismutase family protein [Brumimicrobium sp.]|nr:superoxide dismutase family protein [Brumimicrobium sp.]
MKNLSLYIIIIFSTGLLATSCNNAIQDNDGNNKKDKATAETVEPKKSESLELADSQNIKSKVSSIVLNPASDSNASGDIEFTEKTGQVLMIAKLKGLKPGRHAIHLHETADCSSKDGKSSGGHWNPTDEQHGKWGDGEGYHKGDIGNFEVNNDGTATVRFETSEWCIGCDDIDKNILGRAVVIHQGGDDFTSQPSGDAGKRVGCAEIIDYQVK